MSIKKIADTIRSLSELEGKDFVDAANLVIDDIQGLENDYITKLAGADDKILELEDTIENTNTAKLDAELSKAHKEIADLKKKLGIGQDKDANKTFIVKSLLEGGDNCLHFPGGRMLVIKQGQFAEISFKESKTDYFQEKLKAKQVEIVNNKK